MNKVMLLWTVCLLATGIFRVGAALARPSAGTQPSFDRIAIQRQEENPPAEPAPEQQPGVTPAPETPAGEPSQEQPPTGESPQPESPPPTPPPQPQPEGEAPPPPQ